MRPIDTTTGMNGYPQALRVAHTADTMAELREAKEQAEAQGHSVTVLRLHRRDGWALWVRDHHHGLDDDHWMGVSESDTTIRITNESNVEDEAFNLVVGEGGEMYSAQELFDAAKRVRELADELPDPDTLEEGDEVVCFLGQGHRVEYTVATGQNGYCCDTYQYCSALLVVEREDDEDEA